jgi:cytidyltransferase-like protein
LTKTGRFDSGRKTARMKTVAIASGYFNPIHVGHVRLLDAARKLGDRLVVIVNNDLQQMAKKGKIIIAEDQRLEVVRALRVVDEAVLAVDEDRTVCKTLEQIAEAHRDCRMVFANGGDRGSSTAVPETAVCERFGIEMRFDVGGVTKANSSSNINQRLGREQ